MYCKQCGTKIPDTAKFCGYCGTPVEPPQEETMPTAEPVTEPEYGPATEVLSEEEYGPATEVLSEEEYGPATEVLSEGEYETAAETISESVEPVAWEEPVSDMDWEVPETEEVWKKGGDGSAWEETGKTGVTDKTWSDTWSETAQTSDWNLNNLNDVPLIIEPKKKRSTALTVLTIVGIAILVIVLIVCAVLMLGGDSSESVWHSQKNETEIDTKIEEESDAAAQDSEKENSEEESKQESEIEESSQTQPTSVKLECGVEIPLDATSVDLSGVAVNNLMGIEQCTKLQNIRINGGNLTDLSPLLGLPQLNSLTIQNVPVTDIQILKNIPSLMYLDITDTQVSTQQVKDLQAALPDVMVVGYVHHVYETFQKDCTWSEAESLCEGMGGHLVTITSAEEMKKVETLLENTTLKYFWLGGYSQGDTWYWITGETWGGYVNWYPGEPSKQDTDGTLENCLCLWNVEDGSGWTMNDQRNDLPSFTSTQGKIGYICEYDYVAGYPE